jgi:hypothetical protein
VHHNDENSLRTIKRVENVLEEIFIFFSILFHFKERHYSLLFVYKLEHMKPKLKHEMEHICGIAWLYRSLRVSIMDGVQSFSKPLYSSTSLNYQMELCRATSIFLG